MFESSFEKIGSFSARNSGKVIIFWIVVLVLLAPFASMLFSQTSYDIGNSIAPPNAMSTKASDLQTQYFGGNGSGVNSNQSIVIVTTGTDMNQNAAILALADSQNEVNSTLSNQGITSNFTSILGIENSTLSGVAQLASAYINGTYPLIQNLNNQSYQINGTLNALSGIIYGSSAAYYQTFNTGTPLYNHTLAYEAGLQTISSFNLPNELQPVAYLYYNSFANFVNSTSVSLTEVNSSINQAITNYSSPFMGLLLNSSSAPLYNMSYSINQNFSIFYFIPPDPSFSTIFNNYSRNYTVNLLASQLSSQSDVVNFTRNQLNLTLEDLANVSYNSGQTMALWQLQNTTDRIVTNSTINYFQGSPLISVNSKEIYNYVQAVNKSGNPNVTAYNYLIGGSFSIYPAVPSSYVFHQFVGYDNSTVITILSTSTNLSTAQVNLVENAYHKHLSSLNNANYYIAGSAALGNQLAEESLTGMVRALIIGIVLSVIIVGVFFRSPVAAFLPLAVFGMSAAISISINALIYKYILHSTISFITPTLLLILLLGLSSDYVVYIMSRYRKELRYNKNDASAASSVTSRWAGHAVFTSGITVGLSYVVLWISGVPIFSDSGITNAIGVLVTILIANTFLIAVLSRGKGKMYWPYKVLEETSLPAEKGMKKVADFVVNNKGKILVLFLISTLLGTYVYSITPTNMDVFKLVPASGGIQAIEEVNNSFHGDFFERGFIILEFSSPVVVGNSYNFTEISTITAVEHKLLSSSQVTQVYGPTFPYGEYTNITLSSVSQNYQSEYRAQINTFIGNDSRYVMIDFQLSSLAYGSQPSAFVKDLPNYLSGSTGNVKTMYIGGVTESLNDAYSFTLSTFVKMVPILALAIFVVLLIQISSLFTPIRLILMVFASVLVSLALAYLALHFYLGLPILIFLPMFTVITLLAVGLDYDIFMVARVREEVYKGNTDEEGIKTSITENGGVIITLGTLLFATFGSLAFSGIGIIQEIGIGLGFGVLIDTFISWPFFVPAVMLYLHKYNWWPSKLSGSGKNNKKE